MSCSDYCALLQKAVHLLNNGGEQHSDEYKSLNAMEQVLLGRCLSFVSISVAQYSLRLTESGNYTDWLIAKFGQFLLYLIFLGSHIDDRRAVSDPISAHY